MEERRERLHDQESGSTAGATSALPPQPAGALRWIPMHMPAAPRTVAVALLALLAAFAAAAPPPTAVAAQGELHLTAAGDYGARATTDGVLRTVAALAPDAHFALGDLAYQDVAPESAWCSYVKQRVGSTLPFELVAGNHESSDVPDGRIDAYAACLPNRLPGLVGTYGKEAYVDLPAAAPLARVITASPWLTFGTTRWTYSSGDAHWNWLSAAIDGARAKGIRWVVVAAHIPCLSVGGYTCAQPRDFVNLLMAKKVDLVLQGHEHAYMRTHQLRAGVPGCATLGVGGTSTACIADRDDRYAAGAGTVWATVGTGGIPLRDVNVGDSEAGYFAAFSGANRSPSYGVLDVRITGTQLTGSFVASQGSFGDAFTVDRGTAPTSTFAADTFDRTVPSGFGTAGTGGSWTTSGALSVGSGAGRIRLDRPGAGASAVLPAAVSTSSDVQLRLSLDRIASGNGVSTAVLARRVSATADYRAGIRVSATGAVEASLRVVVNGRENVLARTSVPGITVRPGTWLRVRVQALGAASTTLRVKAWPDGTAEPAGWALQTSTATAGLQTSGSIGLSGYLSSAATNAPVVLSVDDLRATRP
jgi:hypothetical protein